MDKKENWLRTLRNDQPGWIPRPWEAMHEERFFVDPITGSLFVNARLNERYKDTWGVEWLLQEGSPAATPIVEDTNKVIKDITCWQDQVRFPSLDAADWSGINAAVAAVDRRQSLVLVMVPIGIFELSHNLMGFEDDLCNLMLEPEAMDSLFSALADWKVGQLERIMANMKPDIVMCHDDWGSKTNLFMAPEIWRSLIKPHHQRLVDCVKAGGALFMQHADCICEPIAEDMADMGIDIWQGVIPQNNITDIQRRIGHRMALMGGLDAARIDLPTADEQTIRSDVRRCIDTWCPHGSFFPCIPNIAAINPEVERIYLDEITKYNEK